ncbi:hypothetical protein N658DRAFT_507507 [Parathielavia hyrcaniae]|uniref:Uncharacterized protein n=1 Tax=Parathielavia hyrcaniae TaxID=113614 RepID=A0AAN6Q4P9_9PEZI|nr:hypothetical protein N658DRAFT_507507 [Parathielavia hyrcaniae]
MSIWQAYQNLPPKTKLAVGAGLLAWGVLGLQFSDKLESKLGFTPTEADKAELEKLAPRIHAVPRGDARAAGGSGASASSTAAGEK